MLLSFHAIQLQKKLAVISTSSCGVRGRSKSRARKKFLLHGLVQSFYTLHYCINKHDTCDRDCSKHLLSYFCFTMGLGGRREKQVIAADPRNTRWINDTSSPGHRLLSSMGYDPANANSSQHKVGLYGHNTSKRLRQIPIAKAGMEGIGFKPNGPGANVALGALPSRMGGPATMASAASNIFSKLGSRAALQFVTAGSSKEVINRAKIDEIT